VRKFISTFLTMSNRNELYERQMIWAEYRAGSSKEEAHAKLGSDSVSQQTIDDFYQRFQSGDISLFDKGSEQHGIIQAIQKLPNGEEVRQIQK
jgi:hypothetical protein